MTESREELIETLINADNEMGPDPDGYPWADHVLDALLAHPGAVLAELENAPCQTCGGRGCVTVVHSEGDYEDVACSACGGSGKLGRDGLDKLREALRTDAADELTREAERLGLYADERLHGAIAYAIDRWLGSSDLSAEAQAATEWHVAHVSTLSDQIMALVRDWSPASVPEPSEGDDR